MEEIRKSNAGQGFGVAGFVIGLVTLIVSFIPCLGMYALVPGIIAIIFSAVALMQANRANASKGLIIAALVVSVLGTSIALWQFATIKRAASGIDKFGTEFKESIGDDLGNEIRNKIRKALEGDPDAESLPDDTIKFDRKEMIEELERLEGKRDNK